MSGLTWTSEMRAIAQEEGRALVKLQVQLKHVPREKGGGGDFKIVGSMGSKRGLALFLLAMIKDSDPRLDQVLGILGHVLPEEAPKKTLWYTALGKVGPACDDTEGYRCRSCDHTEYTRHDPSDKCPRCLFEGGPS
jgi:hypothetical protein